jgi:hypothetical protein
VIARLALALLAFAAPALAQAPLRAFDAASIESIRQQHAKRPFVLAFWSIHCEPCVREMAIWKDLTARHPTVPVLLVSTDPPAERERVLRFLATHDPGAAVQRWQYADDFEERIRHAVDPRWRGELPRTYLFDAAHRAEAKTGLPDPVELERWLAGSRGRVP